MNNLRGHTVTAYAEASVLRLPHKDIIERLLRPMLAAVMSEQIISASDDRPIKITLRMERISENQMAIEQTWNAQS